MISEYNLMVPLPKKENFKKKVLEYAISNKLGLEMQAFVDPNDFSTKKKELNRVEEYKKTLDKFPNFYSIHGPIFDIKPHAVDREILKIVKKRVETTLSVAKKINCRRVIFHTGYNPLISAERQMEYILDAQVKFWTDILSKYEEITICLENMWDFTPVFLKLLVENVNSKRLGICLDIGHLNVYNKTRIDIWFEELKEKINHLHLHDNNGMTDEHLAIGNGNVKWQNIFDNIESLKTNPEAVIEVDSEDKFYASMKYLKQNNFLKR
ncbi:MAG: sugar phosphate isomerase/epimerase [Candidatus Mcinerneyibacterium aminivorans]|uniref:Sugar phosphate isomerase/epimerase n=1 Tax=Candidatus Mcinerneyibacterium aminivorans TaxID=2703815 RepID=A0A5D0MG87_9BACT|nr:MAG: sugar phosphate isomerase/epimerase [Candidatus Mcinerneyibacterium aminivorans]